ncbi:hypothetical protein HanRHA438_Chr17g0826931 [Helianthus annuus]|nr:hypothetical protein HanRHA438_Chr17g0826931 [Helianthus annuus]
MAIINSIQLFKANCSVFPSLDNSLSKFSFSFLFSIYNNNKALPRFKCFNP